MTALPTITALPTAPSRSDAPATFITRADAFMAALSTFQTELNTFGAAVVVVGSATNYNGTSVTSTAIGTGSKTITIEAAKAFQLGQFVTIASTASPSNYMYGQVTAYNSTTGSLTVNVLSVGGSGTFAAWTVAIAIGAAGYAPLSGADFTGSLSVSGTTTLGGAVNTGTGVSTGDVVFEHGAGRTGDGNAYIDLHATAGTDMEARLIRLSGANGNLSLVNEGTGALEIQAGVGGTLSLRIGSTASMSIGALGKSMFSASTTVRAGFNLTPGVAPTSPANGDIWPDTSSLFYRLNGTTQQVASLGGTETLSNKRIIARIGTVASGATITPTGDISDQYNVTALAADATIAVPSGTPADGQKLMICIKDNGTSRALTWTTSAGGFRVLSGVTLPTATTISKRHYIGCIYNAADNYWDVLAVGVLA